MALPTAIMASSSERNRSHSDYTVACICPMGVELAPVKAMLDHIHPNLPIQRDVNSYILGDISGHNIVVAVLPEIGTNAASTVATQLLNDFPFIRFGLLVGIGGAVPDESGERIDIRLGDVVVSKPTSTFGGVVQYDLGKILTNGTFTRTGALNKPPAFLRSAVEMLAADHRIQGSQAPQYISTMLQRYPAMEEEYSSPGSAEDVLFSAKYPHESGNSCEKCKKQHIIERKARKSKKPKFHYGTIGSSNLVVKDANLREELRQDMDLICLEMEAAGLMDAFPCLVIRGICDYADSHKNKKWQPYAAATAAAYMKELLGVVPQKEIVKVSPAAEVVHESKYTRGLNLFDAPDIGSSDLFVGREREFKGMEAYLKPNDVSSDRKVLALGGMGGIGKTQLAIAYAKKHQFVYSSIFWLNAASEATLKSSFQRLAERIVPDTTSGLSSVNDDEQLRKLVLSWFSELDNTSWLLIFDNYDDPDQYTIRNYYPHVYHGSIIITTRLLDKVSGKKLLVQSINDMEEGLEILRTRSGRENISHDVCARRLVERFAGLPLALATAGAHLHSSVWTCGEYLDEYEKRWRIVEEQSQLADYTDRSLCTTWDLSYARLQADHPAAAELLKLLAYFDNKNIWYGHFCSMEELRRPEATDLGQDRLAAEPHIPVRPRSREQLARIVSSKSQFDQTMAILVRHCFVDCQTTMGAYSMHACIHDWTLGRLNQTIEEWRYWYAFKCVINRFNEEDWGNHGLLQHSNIVPHARRLANPNFGVNGREIADNQIEDTLKVASLLESQVQLNEATVLYERALAYCEKAFGPEHTRTLDTVQDIGTLYSKRSKIVEAEQMYQRALGGYEKSLGPEHTSTLITVANLGILYSDQDRLVEAEQMYQRALGGYEKLLGLDHIATLKTVHNLGNLYWSQDKLTKAEQMYQRALSGYEKTLGPEHSLNLGPVHNLGNLYYKQGKLVEAEQMYQRALGGYEKTIGPEHSLHLGPVNNLGLLYAKRGKLVEAEQMYHRALGGYERIFGPEHSSTLDTVYNLGLLYWKQGKLVEAEQTLKRAVEGRRRVLGVDHSDAKTVTGALNELRQEMNQRKS